MLPSSPQAPPQLPLQRVDLHNSHATARALLSSSPQPSPGPPSNLPRQGKRQLKFNGGGILRLLTWLIVCTLLSWAATRIVHSDRKLDGNKRCVFWPSGISRGRNGLSAFCYVLREKYLCCGSEHQQSSGASSASSHTSRTLIASDDPDVYLRPTRPLLNTNPKRIEEGKKSTVFSSTLPARKRSTSPGKTVLGWEGWERAIVQQGRRF